MELILAFFILITVAILFVHIPIMIAQSKGLTGPDLSTISILSWSSLLLGVTWIVALALAIVWQPKDSAKKASSMDLLSKMHDLMKKGAISKKEFDDEKKKILG